MLSAALAALPAAAHAQAMPVSTFLAKAEALQKKGPMALFSKDVGILKAEIGNAGKLMKAERESATRSGRTPAPSSAEQPHRQQQKDEGGDRDTGEGQ